MAAAAALASLETLAQLRLESRALSPAVWRPAVCKLVEESARSQRAYDFLREIVLSSEPELRYRGVVGLQQAAAGDPETILDFLRDRWEEEDTLADPVLLEALTQTCLELPLSSLSPVLQDIWAQAPVSLRSSLVAVSWKASAEELALRDPSPRVRAHLALHLVEQIDQPRALAVLQGLARDPEREVRAALAVGLAGMATSSAHPRHALSQTADFQALHRILERDSDLSVSDLANHISRPATSPRPTHTTNALQLASELDRQPATSLQKLSPWLRKAGALHRLKTVAEFSCNPEVAQTARVLAVLCDDSVSYEEKLLRSIGILKDVAGDSVSPAAGPVLVELRALAQLCLHLVEFGQIEDVSEWLSSQGDLNWLSTSVLKCRDFHSAIRIVALAGLPASPLDGKLAIEEMGELGKACATAPLPERELIEPAMQHLGQLMKKALSI